MAFAFILKIAFIVPNLCSKRILSANMLKTLAPIGTVLKFMCLRKEFHTNVFELLKYLH